jgi:hypothetical protein
MVGLDPQRLSRVSARTRAEALAGGEGEQEDTAVARGGGSGGGGLRGRPACRY